MTDVSQAPSMLPDAATAGAEERFIPASEMMANLAGEIGYERLSVGEFLDRLDARAPGLLLLILALPMCVPNIPGISTIFGTLLIAPSVQMIFGRSSLWLPKRVRSWNFSGRALAAALRLSVPMLRWVERFTQPRLNWVMRWPSTGLVGLQTLMMALVLILPMWGANLIPGVAVAVTGLAILQRDGALMMLSVPVAAASLAWVYFGAKYVISFATWLSHLGVVFLGGGG